MVQETEYEKQVQSELTKLKEREQEKTMLYDTNIGGEFVPRPTREYIEKCVGSIKSAEMLEVEARANVEKQRLAEKQAIVERQAEGQRIREYQEQMKAEAQNFSQNQENNNQELNRDRDRDDDGIEY